MFKNHIQVVPHTFRFSFCLSLYPTDLALTRNARAVGRGSCWIPRVTHVEPAELCQAINSRQRPAASPRHEHRCRSTTPPSFQLLLHPSPPPTSSGPDANHRCSARAYSSGAPAARSRATISVWRRSKARLSGVWPSLSFALSASLASGAARSCLTTSTWLKVTAQNIGT